ncbi:MAG: hypothetical protein E6J56_09715 [Deltaproteobacteria bacterium]|nr:MAG: hypothetical protein E6J56_09715 [Deltaproteobacteria bacterium]
MSTLSRSARGWTELGAHVVLLLIGLGGMQVAAERTNRRIDLTPGRALSLAPATRKLLAEVTAPLRITVFFRRGTRERHADLVRLFADANPRIAFELLDLDRFPERARSLGVTSYGRAAIEYGGRRAVVLAAPEEELAGGIRRVVHGRRRHLVFTTGHGEREPGGAADGYGRLAAALGAEDYVAGAASLVDGPVPDGTDVLLVAGPRHDFLLSELDAVAAYLAAGGGVVMLLDPAPLPNVAQLLASMGIQLGDDMIVDRERRVLGTDGLAAVVELFKRGNPVTDPDAGAIDTGVVLPSARTVDVGTEVPGVAAETIARTAPSAWTEHDPARARRGEEPSAAAGDTPGSAPVLVMAQVGADDGVGHRRGRLVVAGDADFASDAYLDLLGNRDLALNAIAWVAGEEALAGERPKRVPEVDRPLSPLVLTARDARAIFVAGVVVEPGLVLLAGVVLVGLRRRRG